jgi:uncharacterized repeat protein (TIGR01451 family)
MTLLVLTQLSSIQVRALNPTSTPKPTATLTPSAALNEISVDKKTRSIDMNRYYDNLEIKNNLFADGNLIEFEINIKNQSNKTLSNINVTDKLPLNLIIVFAPSNRTVNNQINWTINQLKPGESKRYLIRAKITDIKSWNLNRREKRENRVIVKVNNREYVDTSNYFIGRKSMPVTGPNILWGSVEVLGILGLGWWLRKIARGY